MIDSREQANEELQLLYAAIVSLTRLFASGVSGAERRVLRLIATTIGVAGVYILKVPNNSVISLEGTIKK